MIRSDVDEYKGVPLGALRIDEVVWTDERAEHIRSRSQRQPGDLNVEPEWATEAALDPERVVRVAGSDPSTQSLKVIGRSVGAGAVLLKVWIWSDDPKGSSTWNGGSASMANPADAKRYEEER